MARPLIPLLNTILFTVLVPGTVAGYVPYLVLGGYRGRAQGPLVVFGAAMIGLGAAIYFRCAWEFAVRGLGTPAPIAPTKYLVTTALHRYVRNPMYIGVGLAILGQASLFGSLRVAGYGALVLLVVHLFVVYYEEPTLHRQFGESYNAYHHSVPRWIPRLRANEKPVSS